MSIMMQGWQFSRRTLLEQLERVPSTEEKTIGEIAAVVVVMLIALGTTVVGVVYAFGAAAEAYSDWRKGPEYRRKKLADREKKDQASRERLERYRKELRAERERAQAARRQAR